MALPSKKKIRGMLNQNQRKQLEELGIDPGPSPEQQVEQEKAEKKRKKKAKKKDGASWRDFIPFLD